MITKSHDRSMEDWVSNELTQIIQIILISWKLETLAESQ